MTDPRIDIAQTVYRFAYGIDQRDWAGYRSIFVEPPNEITFDYSSYHGRPANQMDVDTWISGVTPVFERLDATQHTMSNPLVEIDDPGRSAQCRVYMQAAHFLMSDPSPEFTIGGYYDDHLVLAETDGGPTWRIDAVTLTVWWSRGNPGIMQEQS